MPPELFGADSPLLKNLNTLATLWPIWLPVALGALAIYMLLPRPRPLPTFLGVACGLATLITAGLLIKPGVVDVEVLLFYTFAVLSLISGTLLITQQNPARAALSFALLVLSTCGLFMLLAAPFLMAATIIIYAGAIVVTFLFVLMLCQQAGLGNADARSREPMLATITGFLLLGTLLYVLRSYEATNDLTDIFTRTATALQADSRAKMLESIEISRENDRVVTVFDKARELVEFSKTPNEPGSEINRWFDLRDLIIKADTDWSGAAGAENELAASKEAIDKLRIAVAAVKERRYRGVVPKLSLEGARGRKDEPLPLSNLSGPTAATPSHEIRRNPATLIPELPADNAAFLGRSLFTDYLLAVEIGGFLLLVATVGAIAIAQRSLEAKRSALTNPQEANLAGGQKI